MALTLSPIRADFGDVQGLGRQEDQPQPCEKGEVCLLT